jgi:hypothetical protein
MRALHGRPSPTNRPHPTEPLPHRPLLVPGKSRDPPETDRPECHLSLGAGRCANRRRQAVPQRVQSAGGHWPGLEDRPVGVGASDWHGCTRTAIPTGTTRSPDPSSPGISERPLWRSRVAYTRWRSGCALPNVLVKARPPALRLRVRTPYVPVRKYRVNDDFLRACAGRTTRDGRQASRGPETLVGISRRRALRRTSIALRQSPPGARCSARRARRGRP